MTPAHLTLAAVAALAAAGVAKRQATGSRSVAGPPGWHITVADLSGYNSWRDVVKADAVLVSGYATLSNGGRSRFAVSADSPSLDQYREFAVYWVDDGGSDRSFLDKLQGHLNEFKVWLESLRYPLTLYRGLRLYSEHGLVIEDEHDSWSTFREVARAFADGTHSAATSGDTGVVLSATAKEPAVGSIGLILEDYLRFTAGIQSGVDRAYIHGQWEMGGVDQETVRIQEWVK